MDMRTSMAQLDQQRLEELSSNPLNIVQKPRAEKTMDVLRSSRMLQIIRRTRGLYTRFVAAHPDETNAAARDFICAVHRDAAECRVRFPLVFLTLSTPDLPVRPLQGMKMMIRAFEAFECGLIESEEDAMNFFFATVLPHSFRPDDVLKLVNPITAASSQRERLSHAYLMESIDLIKSIDQKDGFQADVAGAKAMQTVPKRIVRLAMDE
jgi:hypothetical protein